MSSMFLTPKQLICDICHRPIIDGERMVIVEIGTVGRIGGAGIYAAMPILRDKTETHQHEACNAQDQVSQQTAR